jgi:hypothetical protein
MFSKYTYCGSQPGPVDLDAYPYALVRVNSVQGGRLAFAISGAYDYGYQNLGYMTQPGWYLFDVMPWFARFPTRFYNGYEVLGNEDYVFPQLIIEGQGAQATVSDVRLCSIGNVLPGTEVFKHTMTTTAGLGLFNAVAVANGLGQVIVSGTTSSGTPLNDSQMYVYTGVHDLSTNPLVRVKVAEVSSNTRLSVWLAGSGATNQKEIKLLGNPASPGNYLINASTWIGNVTGQEQVFVVIKGSRDNNLPWSATIDEISVSSFTHPSPP